MIGLRAATAADAGAIAEVFTASRELLTFLPKLHTAEEDRAFIAHHIVPEYRLTLAEEDGRLLGYMAEGEAWIEHLYVSPAAVRSGIGSALMAEAKARQKQLELWCFKQNLKGRAFYAAHGFVALYETDGSGNEERSPDVRYRWER
ncbi:GNAT family N-acetyltransferase [Devosia sp.]|uniref:GNAT family N-acetyltransferase n=1 Tax=Devosia sp. TaxID=1871048 RepID=UPI003BAD9E3C